MSLAFTVAIPARLAATRLPGKPLRLLAGRPIIRHVIDRALESEADEIVLATDSEAIAAAAAGATIRVEFTRPDHPSGTDRLAEVAERLAWARDRIVVNLQGDEPLIPASAIRAVARALADSPDCAIATLAQPITDLATFLDPNAVKVVVDEAGRALYFSRAPIPWPRDAFSRDRSRLPEGLPAWRHVGLYAYRAGFLRDYPRLSPGPLESVESLEQLRALSAGERIRVIRSPVDFPPGIDTEADLARVERLFARSAPSGE
jgi:3-deoxy-manno-octulosonate cytidylyltransferase (CMP-KDO synthetase)